jgi:hypothetical protein
VAYGSPQVGATAFTAAEADACWPSEDEQVMLKVVYDESASEVSLPFKPLPPDQTPPGFELAEHETLFTELQDRSAVSPAVTAPGLAVSATDGAGCGVVDGSVTGKEHETQLDEPPSPTAATESDVLPGEAKVREIVVESRTLDGLSDQ